MENSTASTRETLVNDVTTLKDNASKIVQDVKDHASAHVDQAKQKVTDSKQAALDYAASHPFTVLGIGLALGFVVGARSRRR